MRIFVHRVFWWWSAFRDIVWARWLIRSFAYIGTVATVAAFFQAGPRTREAPETAEREARISIGSIAFYVLTAPFVAAMLGVVLLLSPFLGALVLLAVFFDRDVRRDLIRRPRSGWVRGSSPARPMDPLSPTPDSLLDTGASIILCLRESGYKNEAGDYEEMLVTTDDPDQLNFARLGFSFSEEEFEPVFRKWLEAGGSQTPEHASLTTADSTSPGETWHRLKPYSVSPAHSFVASSHRIRVFP